MNGESFAEKFITERVGEEKKNRKQQLPHSSWNTRYMNSAFDISAASEVQNC